MLVGVGCRLVGYVVGCCWLWLLVVNVGRGCGCCCWCWWWRGVRMMIRGEWWNLKRGLFESWCQEWRQMSTLLPLESVIASLENRQPHCSGPVRFTGGHAFCSCHFWESPGLLGLLLVLLMMVIWVSWGLAAVPEQLTTIRQSRGRCILAKAWVNGGKKVEEDHFYFSWLLDQILYGLNMHKLNLEAWGGSSSLNNWTRQLW